MHAPLVLMASSGSKLEHASPAKDLYQGPMWKTLRANVDPDKAPHIVVLSPLHGFVAGPHVIAPYQKLMTPGRARELQYELPQYVDSVAWPKDTTQILLAGSGLYLRLMHLLVAELNRAGTLNQCPQILAVSGANQAQLSQIGRFLRDPDDPSRKEIVRGQARLH
jgi:hypothetical protein